MISSLEVRLNNDEEYSIKKSRAIEALFLAWLNNLMAILVMRIQVVKSVDSDLTKRILFFLGDLNSHYLPSDAPESQREAIRYLKDFFTVYPAVDIDQREAALRRVARIYEAFGHRFEFELSRMSHA